MAEPIQQARLVQASNRGVEPGADLGPSRLRQGLDQFREATRLDLRDRHQLPAAGAAAGAAGDPLAPRLQCFRHAVLHGL